MTVMLRLQTCRLIEKMNKQQRFSKEVGIEKIQHSKDIKSTTKRRN